MKKTNEDNLNEDNLNNEDYIEVYFNLKIRRQLYEIGYIKFYYLDYVVPTFYKYKGKNYKIIDSMWVDVFTGKKIKRRELAFLFQLLFSMFILMVIYIFILTPLDDIFNTLFIISLSFCIIMIWGISPPPKFYRAMTKADYVSPPKNLLEQYREKKCCGAMIQADYGNPQKRFGDQYQEKMSKRDRKKYRKMLIKEKLKLK